MAADTLSQMVGTNEHQRARVGYLYPENIRMLGVAGVEVLPSIIFVT